MLKKLVKTPTKARLINLKVAPTEFKIFALKARKYTGGNVSAWIRYAGTELTPRVKDLTKARKIHAVQRTVKHSKRVVARKGKTTVAARKAA